jgi:hypothetical protein
LLALLEKDVKYTITMSYAHSIIEMPNFFECPSHYIEVVMIPVTEFTSIDPKDVDIAHDTKLSEIFHNMTAVTEK